VRAFRAVGDVYVAGLGPTEREVFATVVADVAALLGAEHLGAEGPGGGPSGPREATDVLGPLDALRMSSGTVPAPDDPAVRRLLPDASRDDPAVSAEFRRLTEADLRSTKVERLRAVWRAMREPGGPGHAPRTRRWIGIDDDDDVVVTRADAPSFAAALTDVRLVLAQRLGLETEEDADRLYQDLEAQAAAEEEAAGVGRPDDDTLPAREVVAREVRAYLGSVYAALSWLQETLVTAMLADLEPDAG
jgi:hypothetical protein